MTAPQQTLSHCKKHNNNSPDGVLRAYAMNAIRPHKKVPNAAAETVVEAQGAMQSGLVSMKLAPPLRKASGSPGRRGERSVVPGPGKRENPLL